MAVLGGFNFTGFSGVNLKNTAAIRLVGDGGFASTLSMRVGQEANREIIFPDKTGTLPIMGTFAVQLPTTNATFFSTAVTVTGIRAEDALTVQLNGGTTSYDVAGTTYVLVSAKPRNGSILLSFNNVGQATAYVDWTFSYLAMR